MTMTKSQLLETAKTMNITGRHDMTKAELERIIEEKTVNAVSANDNRFSNYVKTNPWNKRFYCFSGTKNDEVYSSLPKQAKAMFDFVVDNEFVGIGKDIVDGAKSAGVLKTQQDSATLFAYYARKLEQSGLILADSGE